MMPPSPSAPTWKGSIMITQKLPKSQNRSGTAACGNGTAACGNGTAAIPDRCPRCDDDLMLIHRLPWPGTHIIICRNRRCSYERSYDAVLHDLLESIHSRLVYLEAQHS